MAANRLAYAPNVHVIPGYDPDASTEDLVDGIVDGLVSIGIASIPSLLIGRVGQIVCSDPTGEFLAISLPCTTVLFTLAETRAYRTQDSFTRIFGYFGTLIVTGLSITFDESMPIEEGFNPMAIALPCIAWGAMGFIHWHLSQ